MSLKSSEINHCSWSISAVLESSFISSSCCQACFPSTVRPMNRMWELVLKIFVHSPEMIPLHVLLDAFAVNDEEETSLSSIPRNRRKNISLVQCQPNSFFQWWLFLVKSQQVLFFVVLLPPLIGMQNLSHPVLTHILRADLLESLILCCSNSSQTYLIHQEWVLSLFKDQILISTPYLPCK